MLKRGILGFNQGTKSPSVIKRLPRVTKGYNPLLGVTKGCQKSPKVTKRLPWGNHMSPRVTKCVLGVTKGHKGY